MAGARRQEETIGERLRRLRKQRGLSLRALASPGVGYAFISRIEAGDRQPSVKSIRVLARKLGVTPHYLETGQEVPPEDERELAISNAELELRLRRNVKRAALAFNAELAVTPPDPYLLARAQAGLGMLAAREMHDADAIELLEAATASGELPPDARPDVYENLGRLYTAEGRVQDAIALFERCLREAKERAPDDAALRARFATYLAAAHSALGALGIAHGLLDEATEAAESVPAPQARTNVYWVKAVTEWKAGRSRSALIFMRRAIGLLETGEDTLQTARAHLVAAQMLTLDGRYTEAGKHLDRADVLLVLGADPSDLAVLYAERAKVLAEQKRAEEAVEAATEADRLAQGDGLIWPVVAHALGASYAAKGDLAEGERFYMMALDGLRERRQWREAARVAREWSQVLRDADRVREALDMLEEATVLTARHVGVMQRRL